MKPMTPMAPMQPMAEAQPWWPADLGHPSSSGAQNGLRYAFFQDRQRLIVDRDGKMTTFDTGRHVINGVSQAGGFRGPEFSTDEGAVDLNQLERAD